MATILIIFSRIYWPSWRIYCSLNVCSCLVWKIGGMGPLPPRLRHCKAAFVAFTFLSSQYTDRSIIRRAAHGVLTGRTNSVKTTTRSTKSRMLRRSATGFFASISRRFGAAAESQTSSSWVHFAPGLENHFEKNEVFFRFLKKL